jgi:general secretion pathway protein N
MKKKLAIVVVFLITYLGFLIATLPARVVVNQISLPRNISLSGITGTVWSTNVTQVFVDNVVINQVQAELRFWSLFTLTPSLTIQFGDSFLAGPEGKLDITLSQEKVEIDNLIVLVKANEVAQQLALPLPMTAKGNVELSIIHADIDLTNENQCSTTNGEITWFKAGVIALDQNVKLGELDGKISCEKGALALLLSPDNNLGLTFNAYLRNGRISGNGFLKPGAEFPVGLNSALPFLGRKDNQGRYRLSF